MIKVHEPKDKVPCICCHEREAEIEIDFISDKTTTACGVALCLNCVHDMSTKLATCLTLVGIREAIGPEGLAEYLAGGNENADTI